MKKRALFKKKPSGKNYFLGLFVFLILISGILLVSSFGESDKINDEVYDALEDSENVRVIVKLKEPNEKKGFFIKTERSKEEINFEKEMIKVNVIIDVGVENVKHVFDKKIALEIDEDELKYLKKNNDIEEIIIDKPIFAHLQDSVPHINASVVWPVNLSNQNITGINETICILDTGVDFTHPALVGKNKTCVIDCITGVSCVEDCSVHDDNGHGTHVAGITVASGSINGVAVGANLIGVKVLDSTGSGTGSDLYAGIDWCIANRVAYNISVISMSLGDCSNNNVYCNADGSAVHINNATFYNISVIVSAGNCDPITCPLQTCTGGPSSPACVENATAIGAVNDVDDSIFYQRGNLFELMAPGININSTVPTGSCELCDASSYASYSGTSMSAPHVAGAFALFRQFFRLQNNRVPTPSEIRTEFNSTGKQINDSGAGGTNLNFSRIDVFAAIKSIDTSNPVVSLLSPENNTVQFTQNVTFNCSANDIQLSNITLYVWNSTGVYNNTEISDVSGTNGKLSKEITNLSYGNYNWNCLAYDHNNNFSFATSNFSLTIGQVSTTLNSPSDNSFVNTNQTYNCSAETETSTSLTNITISVWNSTNNLVYNASSNVNGTTNSSLFYFNFTTEQKYTWNCLSYNNESESDWASNFTITFDITNPTIDRVSYSVSTTSAVINVNSSEITNSSINYGTTTSLGTSSTNTNLRNNHLISLSGLSASTTYYYNITNCDRANNCVVNGTNSFTTDTPAPVDTGGSSGGGGGGGGVTTMTYIPSLVETVIGYTKSLSKDEKIKFTLFDGGNVQHTMTLNSIETDSINITIRSDPVIVLLGIGQSIKLNLSSVDYYDLYIKLNSIENNKADITIQTIKEKISEQAEITGEAVKEGEEKKTEREIPKRNLKETFIYALVLIFVVISVVIVLRKKSEAIKRKGAKKEYKERFKSINPKKKK